MGYSISEIFTKYKENMDRQQELDEQLFNDCSKEEWFECLQKRAVENQRMYKENELLIQELEKFLENDLEEKSVQGLYAEAHQMYWDGYDDCQILLPVLFKLIDYYEANPDVEKLLFLYGAIYYEENEVQNRREGVQKYNESYNKKILEYRKDYFSLLTAAGRRRIWGAYYNLIVVGVGNEAISLDESYAYYKEAMDFWTNPEVQALDGQNEEIVGIVERIAKEWLIVEEGIEKACPETQKAFCRLAEEVYRKEMQEKENKYLINSEVYAAYLHAQVLLGKTDMETIVDDYFAYYNEKLKLCPEAKSMTDEDFYFVINTPIIIERWLEKGIDQEKCRQIMGSLKNQTQDTWYEKLEKYASPFLNGIMTEWCFKLLNYLNTQEEKEECLFHLLLRRQLPTYLHSVMVMHLAEELCKEVKKHRPDLLEGIEGVKEEDMVSFVRQCAVLHDVGKTKITDIVNTQGRKLWEREFQGIKMHPVYGAEMLDKDEDLMKYRDIVMGHHKFYDGKGGYPDSFDNTASAYRLIIDMITICDCIDAATDHLGRNYKNAKTLDMVLEELSVGKGSRYNPDLVELIESSENLKEKMRHFVSEGRRDIMYQAYRERVF